MDKDTKRIFNDEEIIDAIKAGGIKLEKVLHYLYHESGYRESIISLLGKQNASREDVKDLFQECVCILLMNIRKGKFQGNSTFNTYFTSIIKRRWWSKFSKDAVQADRIRNMKMEVETAESPEQIILYKEKSQKVEKLLGHMDDKCEKVLSLWSLNYSMKEIAQLVGYNNADVARQKRLKCHRKLMSILKKNPGLAKELKEIL